MICKVQSNVEAEVHDVRFMDQVFLALEAQPAGVTGPGLAAVADVVVERDHFGTDEAALEIRVYDAGCLGRSTAPAHGPGPHLLRPGREICNQAEQLVGAANYAIEP